ncbi:MAG TPA: hypothetical protein VNB64_01990 [Solirubrobacteraceae bacterium]|nr:hypothetical protein [Solirubrobacteraceae bacterium]
MRRAFVNLWGAVPLRELTVLWLLVLAASAILAATDASAAPVALVFGALGGMLANAFRVPRRPGDPRPHDDR